MTGLEIESHHLRIKRGANWRQPAPLVRAGFGDRLMFGSDQMIWPETIGLAVEAIESAHFLSEEQRRDIFFNNAVRFFGFDAVALEQSSW